MFAIFRHCPAWGFDSLPENYRNNPFFTLDADIVFATEKPESPEEPHDEEAPEEERTEASLSDINTTLVQDIPLPIKSKRTVAARCRDIMSQMKSLSYIVDDVDTLREVQETLENCLQKMETCAPKASNGLILEQDKAASKKKSSGRSATPALARLPLSTGKGKFTGRVGQAANNRKRGWHVNPLISTVNSKRAKVEDLETEILGVETTEDMPDEDREDTEAMTEEKRGDTEDTTREDRVDTCGMTGEERGDTKDMTEEEMIDTGDTKVEDRRATEDMTGDPKVDMGNTTGEYMVEPDDSTGVHRLDIENTTGEERVDTADTTEEMKGVHASSRSQLTTNVNVIDDDAQDPNVWIHHNDSTSGRKTMLYADSKTNIINPGAWLADSEVEAAQNLLKMKFPLIDGLEDPAIAGTLVTPAISEFIQVINTGSHWVCLSSISCPAGVVKVYDSLYGRASTKAVDHACRMLFHRGKTVTLIHEKVQKQKGINDCGLFAIAFATTLCHGHDPATTRYDQKAMRQHLVDCLESLDISEFPSTDKRVPLVEYATKKSVPIYCSCRMPNNNKEYVQCDGCREWFHPTCANIPSVVVNTKRQWRCFTCRQNRKK